MRSLNSILITGGAGYVGSVLVRKLVSLGYDVKVIDSLVFGNDGISSLINEKKIEFFNLDIRETEKFHQLFKILTVLFILQLSWVNRFAKKFLMRQNKLMNLQQKILLTYVKIKK